MKAQRVILIGMIIIVVSALASVQSTYFVQRNTPYALLRILGLAIGFFVVVYGVYRNRSERIYP